MTALSEALKAAGADTVGARVSTLCVEGLRLYSGNIMQAWNHVGSHCGYALLQDLAKDMQLSFSESSVRLVKAETPSPERVKRVQKMLKVVSRYKTSAGIPWGDIGWHELPAMARDGNEAAALLAAGPAGVPNDGRTVDQVFGSKKTEQIVQAARAAVA